MKIRINEFNYNQKEKSCYQKQGTRGSKMEQTDKKRPINYFDDRFNVIYDMLSGSVIRGVVFSVYDKYGPQTLYSFPLPVDQIVDGFGLPREELIFRKIEKTRELKEKSEKLEGEMGIKGEMRQTDKLIQTFTSRDYLQIAIKSVSLLIGEKIFDKDPNLLKLAFFGVLPYPDLDVCAYTYFKFYSLIDSTEPKVCTFSLLIDNNRRYYIYENIKFLRAIIEETVNKLIVFLSNKSWSVDSINKETSSMVNDIILDFFMKIKLAENRPYTPVTSKQKIKILFVGLKHSGKSSFLLTINRKHSELTRRDSDNSEIHIADMLGTTVIKWDLGEDLEDLNNFKSKAEIYLFDTNLIYFFVNGTDFSKIDENVKWFELILKNLKRNSIEIPIIIVITRVDSDISEKPEIRKIISEIKSRLSSVTLKYMKNFSFFETSLFDISTILSAFSNGLTLLSPNKDISEYKLREYANKIKASAIMLFNDKGLNVAQYVYDPEFDLKHSYPLRHVIETLSSQYINIYTNIETEKEYFQNTQERLKWSFLNLKSQNKESTIDQNQIIFQTIIDEKSQIILKKMQISDYNIYILIFLKAPFMEEKDLLENLSKLEKDFTEILQVYMI